MLPGYMQGIEEAGGAPVMLPLCTDRASLERLAEGLDGLLLSGRHCQRPVDSLPLPRTVDCWHISTILEAILNSMAGQWILLVLKAGYLTNTTYGDIQWTNYIKKREGRGRVPQQAEE